MDVVPEDADPIEAFSDDARDDATKNGGTAVSAIPRQSKSCRRETSSSYFESTSASTQLEVSETQVEPTEPFDPTVYDTCSKQ